jgi:hypothetical protein
MRAPHLHTFAEDARPYLRRAAGGYDAIFVDAYRQPYIPFYLATAEFFRLVREHLRPGGAVALNVATTPHDRQLSRAVGTTLLTTFPQAWRWRALRFNDVLFALREQITRAGLLRRAERAPAELRSLLPLFDERLAPIRPHGTPLTDDRAPVEWLTDHMILDQAERGGRVDEPALPTAPGG